MGGRGRTAYCLTAVADVFTKKKRSDVMSRIRSTGNKDTELRLIQIFRAHGIIRRRRVYG